MTKKEILSEAFKAKPANYPKVCFRYIIREGDILKFQFLNFDENIGMWLEGNYFEKPVLEGLLMLMDCP